jgi:hypothetical protein
MLVWRRTTVLLLATCSWIQAQLVLENPKHLKVPEQQAQALFLTTNRVMEKEFSVPGALENKFRMKLVLGEAHERYTIDDAQGDGTLYLERWNEYKFTNVAMRLAIQQLLVPERQERMIDVIVRRAHEIAPVSAAELKVESVSLPPVPPQNDCMARMNNAALGGMPCKQGLGVQRPTPMTTR